MKDNETIKDILAEMRDFAEHRDFDSDGNMSTTALRVFADRIEAALRDKVETTTIAVVQAINLTNEKWRRESGNAAAMREALCEIQRMAHEGEGEHDLFRCQQWVANINNAAKAALAAPARNIDRFVTEGEAWRFYLDHVPDNGNLATGYAEWLFATELIYGDAAAEGGAE